MGTAVKPKTDAHIYSNYDFNQLKQCEKWAPDDAGFLELISYRNQNLTLWLTLS